MSKWREERDKKLADELAIMVPLDQCKDRVLYRINARNLKIGVYNKIHQEFIGIRTKFGSRFLDSENHWDCKEFATAKPMEELEELPADINNDIGSNEPLFKWLEEKEKIYNKEE